MNVKYLDREHIVGLAVFAIVLFCFAFPKALKADSKFDEISGSVFSEGLSGRLENLLLEMGYVDVDVSACVLQFRRKFPDQCPTDMALSYWRSIDLQNLDIDSTSGVFNRKTNQEVWYYFSIKPTREYYWRSIGINGFNRRMKETYSGAGWPFRFDEFTPMITRKFYSEFPREANMNWRLFESCFGQSPGFGVDFRMTGPDRLALTKFRAAIIEYAEFEGCNAE